MSFAKNLGIIIVSIGIGFGATYIVAESNSTIGASSIPFILLPIFTIISAFFLRSLFGGGGIRPRRSAWGPPAQDRDKVVSSPQFVGRFDREKGLLEATARMVMGDYKNKPSYWSQRGVDYFIVTFRAELLDQQGSPLEYIPVEIMAKKNDFVGVIVDGDRLRVEGKMEPDGIFRSDRAFNFSTNSYVGNTK